MDRRVDLSSMSRGPTSSCCNRGFHSLSTYAWKSKEGYLTDEADPIMYANCRGEFTCEISTKVDGEDKKVVLTFNVSSECSEHC